jgi:hypothetical protein
VKVSIFCCIISKSISISKFVYELSSGEPSNSKNESTTNPNSHRDETKESSNESEESSNESEESSNESEKSSNESEGSGNESEENSNKCPPAKSQVQDDATQHTAVVAAGYTVHDEDGDISNVTATLTSSTQPTEVIVDSDVDTVNLCKKSLCMKSSTVNHVCFQS